LEDSVAAKATASPIGAVAFRFKASGTAFQVDDVYLDPWKSY
jgi:hypothetical protein